MTAAGPAERSLVRAFSVRLHDTLDAVEPMWRDWQRDGASTVFQNFDWAWSIARHLAAAERAEVVVAEVIEAGSQQPIMLLPLVRFQRLGHVAIEWLDLGVCDYASPVMAPDTTLSAADAIAVWDVVKSALPAADLIRIDGIPRQVFGIDNPLVLLPHVRQMDQQTFGIGINGDPEGLLKLLCSSSFLRNHNKEARRLAKMGEVKFVEATTPEEVAAIFAVLVEQRTTRFREMGRFDLLTRGSVVQFYHDAAVRSLVNGPVRLFGLSVDGAWIATIYGLVHHGAFHTVMTGMLGKPWNTYSPGVHVITQAMKWSLRNDLNYFDLCVGALSYKKDLGMEGAPLFEVAEALTFRGAAVLRGGRLLAGSKAWLARHPEVFERLRSLRQFVRKLTSRSLAPNAAQE